MATTALLLIVGLNAAGQDTATQSAKQPIRPNGAIPTRQSNIDKAGATGAPCVFDSERGDVPDCVRVSTAGELSIAPQILKELSFDSFGLAAVLSKKTAWMYVTRKGRVIISGVPAIDNRADSFHDGLVRFVRKGKYGFANPSGQVIVPPIYDGAMNFDKGVAEVCKGCTNGCVSPGCEYHMFRGGEWFRINIKGTVLGRLNKEDLK
jgi:hypothetical protein